MVNSKATQSYRSGAAGITPRQPLDDNTSVHCVCEYHANVLNALKGLETLYLDLHALPEQLLSICIGSLSSEICLKSPLQNCRPAQVDLIIHIVPARHFLFSLRPIRRFVGFFRDFRLGNASGIT